MFYRLSVLCLLLTCFACAPRTAESTIAEAAAPAGTLTVDFGEDVIVSVGQSVQVQKSQAGFTFTRVVTDSRCPKGVNCVQPGSAVVLVTLPDGSTRTVDVPAASRQPANFGVPGGSVNVLKLEPYPEGKTRIAPEEYRMRVRFGTAVTE